MQKLLLSNIWITCLELAKYVYDSKYAWIRHVFWICLNIQVYAKLCLSTECSVQNMPEYGWSRMSKYYWITFEYVWIKLKYNVKDTVKLLWKLDNRKKGAFRNVSNVQDWAFWNCFIWYYKYTVESENALWLEYSWVWIYQGCRKFRICVSMLLNNAWIHLLMSEAEPRIVVQVK